MPIDIGDTRTEDLFMHSCTFDSSVCDAHIKMPDSVYLIENFYGDTIILNKIGVIAPDGTKDVIEFNGLAVSIPVFELIGYAGMDVAELLQKLGYGYV